MTRIQPVILAGGEGTRLWPASRSTYPKQLLPMVGDMTLLQDTLLRLDGIADVSEEAMVVCSEAHRFLVAAQLGEINKDAKIILEPEGRNTAPAVALAALLVEQGSTDDSPLLLVMPADHVIRDLAVFHKAALTGTTLAEAGGLVTFGVPPTYPESGYGYIQAASADGSPSAVRAFVEKPDLKTAESYIRDGGYYWNSGLFLFTADAYIAALEEHAAEIIAACRRSAANSEVDGEFIRPDADSFLSCPGDSIDYAIMEKTQSAFVVPLDAGWSDIGSWAALHDSADVDADGNKLNGDVTQLGCSNTLINAESRLVSAVGISDAVIVETRDAVLVIAKDSSQDVKRIVDNPRKRSRTEADLHRKIFRPWGGYDSIDSGAGFQQKRLIVNPGAALSLQKHARRDEHWTVVKGMARVTLDERKFDLKVNESTHIPVGAIHRIENPFEEPVHIIEVQCGDYLGEDDIVRLEDDYGRQGTMS